MKKIFVNLLVVSIISFQGTGLSVNAEINVDIDKDEIIIEQFEKDKEVFSDSYYEFLVGNISKDELFSICEGLELDEEIKVFIEDAETFKERELLGRNFIVDAELKNKMDNTGGEKVNYMQRATSNTLPGLHQTCQIKNYYCGPATASMIIMDKNGATPGQDNLAKSLGTTTSGTAWRASGKYPMKEVLNSSIKNASYQVYAADGKVNSSSLSNKVIASIDRGYGVAANIVQVKGSSYKLVDHPDQDLQHWIAIDGYSNSGSTIHYAEPVYKATSVSWYKSINNPYYNISATTLANLIKERGLIW